MWLINTYQKSFSGLSKNIWILSLAMFVNRVGSMVLLFSPLYFTQDLGFSMSQSGFAMGAYGVGSILGSYTGGVLSDKFNFLKIQVSTLVLAGLSMLPMLLVTSYPILVVLLFLIGMFSDMFRPANSIAVATFSKPENRTRSFSLIRLAVNLGFGIGPAIGGITAATIGFKWVFLFDAITCFFAAILLFSSLPFSNGYKKENTSGIEPVKGISAYKDWQYLLFILFVTIYGVCFFQLFASVPLYFSKVHGFSEKTIGYLLALNGLIIVAIEMPIVARFEKYKRPMVLIAFGCILLAMSFPFLFMKNMTIFWSIVYTLFITLSEIFAMPYMINFAVSRPAADRQGQYMALYSIAYGAANIIAPSVGLGIADKYGFGTLYTLDVAIAILLAFGFFSLRRRHS